jgi:hypothetical protein
MPPDWLPPLIRLDDFRGDWKRYINEVFAIFHRDFIKSQPRFRGRWVRCRRDPIYDGKEAGFWHCVSQGQDEQNRVPDLRRCERIGWIRAVLGHLDDVCIGVWSCRKNREQRFYVWFDEAYLVVLGERKGYYQLITAFCTDSEHTKSKLRRECDVARNS